jgi:hypothetical protein
MPGALGAVPYGRLGAMSPTEGFRGHPSFLTAFGLRMEAVAQGHRAAFGVFFYREMQTGTLPP